LNKKNYITNDPFVGVEKKYKSANVKLKYCYFKQ